MSRHDLTAHIAYTIFTQRGYTHGRHVEDWFTAEAIVGLCEQALSLVGPSPEAAASPDAPASQQVATPPSSAELAMRLLEDAVAARGRKAVAGELGYRSASTVGKYLRGDREPSESLVEKIVAAFGQRARRAA